MFIATIHNTATLLSKLGGGGCGRNTRKPLYGIITIITIVLQHEGRLIDLYCVISVIENVNNLSRDLHHHLIKSRTIVSLIHMCRINHCEILLLHISQSLI